MLHLLVSILAIFSICENRFDLWIDLRLLGPVLTTFVKILWTGTALLVPVCAGPRLTGIRKPQWINRGFAPNWADAFLWPTYFFILCLAANTVYWFMLVARNVYTFSLPITLVVAMLLGAWVLCTREWIRTSPSLPPTAPATLRSQILAILLAFFAGAATFLIFALLTYSRPPVTPVDLAVVLGNRVLHDGSASIILEERTLAAIHLYQRGFASHLLLSGAIHAGMSAGDPTLNEPAAMREVCLKNGIPDSAISLDPYGVNTRATAFNTKAFMQARGYSTVAACSSDYHLFRTARSFREVGINAFTVPAQPNTWICADPGDTLREMVAIIVYTLDPNYRPAKAAAMNLQHPSVIVHKSTNTLELFDGTNLYKTYACITGNAPGDKETEGDRRTPLGRFHIVYKNPQSKYHLSMGLDYPNEEDAARGLAAKLITQQQYEDILAALHSDLTQEENQKKLWYTPLGGEIFLHGHAEGRAGTAGCVALANPDIDELYAMLDIGTPVEIRP